MVMAKRLCVSMNVNMWRWPPVDVGVIGPMVSLDMTCPGWDGMSVARSWVWRWALPDAHAEQVILSDGLGCSAVRAGYVLCLAIVWRVDGGA